MQTAMHPAFEQKLAVLAALFERSEGRGARKLGKPAPRYQASGKGDT